MKSGFGYCPGTCGELVQGYMGKNEYISSYCIDLYSEAKISESVTDINLSTFSKKSKSINAIKIVLKELGISEDYFDKLHLEINSNIPTGKGMASSTADIGASIMAILDYFDIDINENILSKLVSLIEPTDAIYNEKVCIFDPIRGLKKEDLGFIKEKKVLIIEPNFKINTLRLRNQKDYYKKLAYNRAITTNSFNQLKKGIKENNNNFIKKACENSAKANESIKKTPYLKEIIEISELNNYSFLNISHTGSVVGIVLNDKTDYEKIIYSIKNSEISKVYKRHYIRDIIKGGARKGGLQNGLYKRPK